MRLRQTWIGWVAWLVIVLSICSCKSTSTLTPSASPSTEVSKPLAKSLLWKIERNGQPNSYLFGTIHLIGEDDYFFPEYMEEAFDQTGALALEFNLDDAMDMGNMMSIFQKALMRGDTTLQDLMSADDFTLVQNHFDEMGLPIFMLQRIKPMFLTIFGSGDLFSGDGFNMEDIKSYEMELTSKAKATGKELQGLETMDYQLGIFDRIPYRVQADMLLESINSADVQTSELDSLIHLYKQQDLEKLDALINASGPTLEYRDILLDERNRNWIPVIDSLSGKQSTFFAVGAGHLPGSQGVIKLLRKAGFQVTPIFGPNGSD
ncbi:MAG: TraB/GumN family protein [Saprospiraceae bacterium]|nr:TraB/GumN family protein [Saprospiraceae bacterium]